MHEQMQVTENTVCLLIKGALTDWSDVAVFAYLLKSLVYGNYL